MTAPRAVVAWLWGLLILLLIMVSIGGITRLTGSGLSMVTWRPIMGIFPPLSESDWTQLFYQYQQFPEYQFKNFGMSLGDFKKIFFWEYLHRVLGRIIGLVALVGWLGFSLKNQLNRYQKVAMGRVVLLIGLQGFIGWMMVRSGLIRQPEVSHIRLATHLMLALGILAQTGLVLFRINKKWPADASLVGDLMSKINGFGIILAIQIFYGALVAGLKAGYLWNSWPKMDGFWLPPVSEPFSVLLFFNHPGVVQFVHRWIAILLLGYSAWILISGLKSHLNPSQRQAIFSLILVVVFQVIVGITILVLGVPVVGGVIHQGLAAVLCLVWVKLRAVTEA